MRNLTIHPCWLLFNRACTYSHISDSVAILEVQNTGFEKAVAADFRINYGIFVAELYVVGAVMVESEVHFVVVGYHV